jgi:hypothetical protein
MSKSKKKEFTFELLCIEPEDIKNESAFSKAISFSDSLWKGKEPIESKSDDSYTILEQPELDLTLKIMTLDTSNMFTDYIETGFILKIYSDSFDELEEFRIRILKHLKSKLKFELIRVLRDDISTYIANKLYPKINEVENLLRRYLIKFFIQRVGIDWWEVSASEKMITKVKIREKDRKDEFANYIKADIEYADFDDLGTLIYKQSSGFNQPEKAIEHILKLTSVEELELFKSDLQGNYTKYFKENFRDKNFEKLWTNLFKIRNKVAHQGTLYKDEFDTGVLVHKELVEIIETAESKIDELVLSVHEKEALRQISIDVLTEDNTTSESESDGSETKKLRGVKVVGKIDIAETNRTFQGHKVLTIEELYEELQTVQSMKHNDFVGLKWFVTQYLADKNYSIGFSYSLINILRDKGEIELFDVAGYGGYDIKAIKTKE